MVLDFLILIFIIIGAGYGLMVGGVKQIFSILSIIAGFLSATILTRPVAEMFKVEGGFPQVVIFLILFVLGCAVVIYIGKMIRKILHLMLLGMIDRLLGLLIGLVKGYIGAFIISLLFLVFKPELFHQSKLAPYLLNSVKIILGEIIK